MIQHETPDEVQAARLEMERARMKSNDNLFVERILAVGWAQTEKARVLEHGVNKISTRLQICAGGDEDQPKDIPNEELVDLLEGGMFAASDDLESYKRKAEEREEKALKNWCNEMITPYSETRAWVVERTMKQHKFGSHR